MKKLTPRDVGFPSSLLIVRTRRCKGGDWTAPRQAPPAERLRRHPRTKTPLTST